MRRVIAEGAVECLFKPFSEHGPARRPNAALRMRYDTVARLDILPFTWRSPARCLTLASIVFVVDDDMSVRESLEPLISTAGWQPETFASAQEFLVPPTPHSSVLSGARCELPGLSGLELQQQLAERTDMPIIFITGHGDVPMTVQAMKAGAVEFLTKPFRRRRAVGRHPRRHRAESRRAPTRRGDAGHQELLRSH